MRTSSRGSELHGVTAITLLARLVCGDTNSS
jgi:hypothetical protein